MERRRGDRPTGGRLQGGTAARLNLDQYFRTDDRQPDRDGERATFDERQLRDHRFAGRAEDCGRRPTVLAQFHLSTHGRRASRLGLHHPEHAFGDGCCRPLERRPGGRGAPHDAGGQPASGHYLARCGAAGDIALGNSIFSSQMSNLELTIRGKGVVSDSTRQPNIVIRTLLKLLNF